MSIRYTYRGFFDDTNPDRAVFVATQGATLEPLPKINVCLSRSCRFQQTAKNRSLGEMMKNHFQNLLQDFDSFWPTLVIDSTFFKFFPKKNLRLGFSIGPIFCAKTPGMKSTSSSALIDFFGLMRRSVWVEIVRYQGCYFSRVSCKLL